MRWLIANKALAAYRKASMKNNAMLSYVEHSNSVLIDSFRIVSPLSRGVTYKGSPVENQLG